MEGHVFVENGDVATVKDGNETCLEQKTHAIFRECVLEYRFFKDACIDDLKII